MAFEDFLRALGMVDEQGNVFDEQEIQRQVLSALGVGQPALETVETKKPPFGDYYDCYEACLALPEPWDAEFAGLTAPAQALAVATIFEMEWGNGGVQQYLYNCGSAYALRTADALREIGLPEHAATFEAFLAENHLDRDALDAICPEENTDEEEGWEAVSEDALITLYERLPSEKLEAAADWDLLQGAILAYANAHPEVFAEPDDPGETEEKDAEAPEA